jgi:putative peptidoglycan lipid II flippase
MAAEVTGQERSSGVQQGILRAATIILLGNILSRLVGFARDILITAIYGTGANVSAYLTALKLQTSVYDLLVSGVISAAFIPVFSELRDRREEFGRVASSVLTIATIVMVLAALLAEIFAVPLIALLSAGQTAVDQTAVSSFRLMAPAIVFLGISGVLTALLYAKQRFVYPAFTPVIFNAMIVVCAAVLHGPLAIKALVVGVLLGAFGQVVLQANGLRGIQLRPRFDTRDPQVRRIGKLYLPVALGLIVTQAQVFLDLALQNSTGTHSVAWLNLATRVYQLPLGFVATAMSLASLPTLSVLTGVAYRETLIRGLKVVVLLIAPAIILLATLGTPIMTLAFQHGNTHASDITHVVQGLDYYLPGLGFAAVDQLLIFAFYARNDTVTPVLVGLLSIVGYGIAALISLKVFNLGYKGLALADSVKQVTHAVTCFILLWRWQGSMAGFGVTKTALKIGVAALGSALICVGALHLAPSGGHGIRLLFFVVVSCGAGLASYFVILSLLRTEELVVIEKKLLTKIRIRH